MPVFSGQSSGTMTSTAYTVPYKLNSFTIVNKTGGDITVNVGILFGSSFDFLPYNLVLNAGDMVDAHDMNRRIEAGHQIYLTATGTVDYYFSLE